MLNNNTDMDFNSLVEALRSELQEYGGLRNILDDQQKAIFARDAQQVSQLNETLEVQMAATAQLRQSREEIQAELVAFHELPKGTSVADLSKVFPENGRPLLTALADQINDMIKVLRRRSRQNQMLLARTCETMEQTLRFMRPEAFTKTYSAKGAVALQLGPIGSHMEAAG